MESSGGELDARLVKVPFGLGKAEFGALLCLDDSGTFVAASIVDDFGEPQAEWRNLIDNLRHYEVPKLEGARPRSHLREVREAASGSASGPPRCRW